MISSTWLAWLTCVLPVVVTATDAAQPAENYRQIAGSIVDQLTLEEKARLFAGNDTWSFGGVARLGVPPTRVADCGHGVTLHGVDARPATCLPTAIGMAATWDPELLEEAGAMLGRECRALGINILLGPAVNLHRLPIGGRNYETFSEDPYLTGKMAAALVRGIQSTGTGACVKHLAGNAQQTHQNRHSVEVDDRTLHELYLRQFAIINRDARPAALMTAYNRINGHYSSESPMLIKQFVRNELKFDGVVMSDWGGVHSPAVIEHGLDVEMPGPAKHLTPAAVLKALQEGVVSLAEIDERAKRVITANLAYAIHPGQPAALDTPAHRALALKVAEASITLLSNSVDLLPLKTAKVKRIAVIGPNAATARLGGSGSAWVNPPYTVSFLEGIRKRFGPDSEIVYAEGCSPWGDGEIIAGRFQHEGEGGVTQPGLDVTFFDGLDLAGSSRHRRAVDALNFQWGWAPPVPGVTRTAYSVRAVGELVSDRSGPTDFKFVYQGGGVRLWLDDQLVLDDWDLKKDTAFEERFKPSSFALTRQLEAGQRLALKVEFRRRTSPAALRLQWASSQTDTGINAALAAAKSADVVVICGGLNNMVEGGGMDRTSLQLPWGQDALIEAVTAVNPNTVVVLQGGTAMAMPWLSKVAAVLHAYYPGQEGGTALARILAGDCEPTGRLPDTIPVSLEDVPGMNGFPGTVERVSFDEGLFMGYRHFVTRGVRPLFPFGHGLGYTRFTYANLVLSDATLKKGGEVQVTVDVTNTGSRHGAEVVQLYVGAESPSAPRASVELKGFNKIRLAPGETRRVTFSISSEDLAAYSRLAGRWQMEKGRYRLRVGPNSMIGLTGAIDYSGP